MKVKTLIFTMLILLFTLCSAFSQTMESTAQTAEVKQKPAAEAAPYSLGEIRFKDMSDDHWASGSVYDLVNMGVTQGFPDGTFRGNERITRYEAATLLSKLAESIENAGGEQEMAVEKMKDDLRAEIRDLRAQITELRRLPAEGEEKPISGSYNMRMILGNIIARNTSQEGVYAPVGPLVRYRLKTTFVRSVGEGATLKMNIDTMDSGFGGGVSNLSTKILDVEGKMTVDIGTDNPVILKVTSGPGPVVHTEEADTNGNYIARAENGVVYMRPWNSVMFSSRQWGLDMGLGYIARRVSPIGEVEVNQFQGLLGYNFPGLFFVPSFRLNTSMDYLSTQPQASPAGPNDTKLTMIAYFSPTQRHKASVTYSYGQGGAEHNAMLGIDIDFLDVWDTGTLMKFKYKKVGAEYLYENAALSEDLFAGLDLFNRYIGNGNGAGVVDLGGEISQVMTETINFVTTFDWRLAPDNSYGTDFPQCSLLVQSGFNWYVATDTLLEVLYSVDSIPSADDKSTDMAQVSMSFKF